MKKILLDDYFSEEVLKLVQEEICKGSVKGALNKKDNKITNSVKVIRKQGEYREDIKEVVSELARTNKLLWEEQDRIHSDNDEEIIKGIESIHPLNQHRNDLIEEIDEIILNAIDNSIQDEITAQRVLEIIEDVIISYNKAPFDYKSDTKSTVYDKIAKIALINSIIWKEEDKVRENVSEQKIVQSVRKMNYLNKERNILIESIDNDMIDYYTEGR